MEPIRIGDKLINKSKLFSQIETMLNLRIQGFSQQDVAKEFGTDRAFVSRLESLGEIRKGGKVALVAFPISNKNEIATLAAKEGIEYCLLFTEKERWDFVKSRSGPELLNDVMGFVTKLKGNDVVIVAASDMRIHSAQALLDKQVMGISLGESPIEEDKYLEPQLITKIMASLQGRY